ncbi:hypothetical protein [Vibrio mediterranei]|uniref:hypothetical protein n=1 Tax=Vibrio mediterranei TaxID=689 RepID=UPI00148E750A|nr:hypothetical protein [Vibrio mediterranei]NOH29411.1 hypothetical protein [Vibrio mediterranei]
MRRIPPAISVTKLALCLLLVLMVGCWLYWTSHTKPAAIPATSPVPVQPSISALAEDILSEDAAYPTPVVQLQAELTRALLTEHAQLSGTINPELESQFSEPSTAPSEWAPNPELTELREQLQALSQIQGELSKR